MVRAWLLTLTLLLAAAEELEQLPLDDCDESSESCALQALQHHAVKTEIAESIENAKVTNLQTATAEKAQESTAKMETKADETEMKEQTVSSKKVEKKQKYQFECKKDTGGTCSWFGCSKSRGADCKDGKCQCGPNLCARDGKCQIAEGYKMASTTLQERDTGGSCRFFSCDASRGPTHCDRNQGYKCYCAEGFFSKDGQCIPKLVPTNPAQGAPAPYDWTKVDWSKVFQKYGWGATTDWSKIDWNKIYGGAGTPGNPLGSSYGVPYGQPAPGLPPYAVANPYAYANPYGVPFWR